VRLARAGHGRQIASFPHFPQARRRFLPSVEKPTDSARQRGDDRQQPFRLGASTQRGSSCALGEHENEMQMNARAKPTQSEFVADSRHAKPSVDPPAIRLADLKNDLFRNGRPSLGGLDPLGSLGRLDPLSFARYLITFSVGLAVALAWQSYSGATREAASLKAISLDRESLRQSIDRIATSQEQMTRSIERGIERGIDRLAASQEETTREISDLQTVEQFLLDRVSALPQRPAPSAAGKFVLRPPVQTPHRRASDPGPEGTEQQ
jgi:hypothetical protein